MSSTSRCAASTFFPDQRRGVGQSSATHSLWSSVAFLSQAAEAHEHAPELADAFNAHAAQACLMRYLPQVRSNVVRRDEHRHLRCLSGLKADFRTDLPALCPESRALSASKISGRSSWMRRRAQTAAGAYPQSFRVEGAFRA